MNTHSQLKHCLVAIIACVEMLDKGFNANLIYSFLYNFVSILASNSQSTGPLKTLALILGFVRLMEEPKKLQNSFSDYFLLALYDMESWTEQLLGSAEPSNTLPQLPL